MAGPDFAVALADLDRSLSSIEAVVDPDRKRTEIAELEQQVAAPDLWDNQDNAQRVTSRLSTLQAEVDRVVGLRAQLEDLGVLVELGQEEGDASQPRRGSGSSSRPCRQAVEVLEVRTLLSGEYDERDALVTIRSEAGGVDAADFAAMLLRMYLRWAERHRYPTEVYDTSYAEEAGIKSATFQVKAPFAYGTLSVEQGTHRLVRISPFDNQGRRQTSFAGVEVLPVTEAADHIDIPESDLRIDVFRSSGPGGQSVNTTDSAVRITHLPTGIVVSCQNEKSQLQNKAAALRVLQSRLLETGAAGARGAAQCAEGRRRQQLGLPDALLRAAPVPDGQGLAHRLRGVVSGCGLRRRSGRLHRVRHPLADDQRVGLSTDGRCPKSSARSRLPFAA